MAQLRADNARLNEAIHLTWRLYVYRGLDKITNTIPVASYYNYTKHTQFLRPLYLFGDDVKHHESRSAWSRAVLLLDPLTVLRGLQL